MLERDQRVEIKKNWELFQVAAYQNWQDSVQQIERDGVGNLVVNEPKVVAYRHDNGEVSIIRLLPESSSVSGSTVRTSPVSTNIELAYFHPGVDGYYDVTRLFPAEMQSFFSAPRGLQEINKYLNDLMASFNRTPTDATTEPDTNISEPARDGVTKDPDDLEGMNNAPENVDGENLEFKALMITTKWLEQNRPDLQQYVSRGTFNASKEVDGERYFVSMAINGPKGYEYLGFWVILEENSAEFISSFS